MEHPELAHHDIFHMHDEHEHDHLSRDQIRAPKVSLRSMSKSDPHLNIPHLLMSQDETHPSLNRIVSGLFHVNNALHTPVTSCDNLQDLHHGTLLSSSKHHLLPNETSAALLSDPLQQPTLRKSSSAIDWNGAVIATRKNSKQVNWQGDLFDQAHTASFSQLNTLGTPSQALKREEDHQYLGGLVMSSSAERNQNMSVVASQMPNPGHFAQGITSASLSQPLPKNPLDPHHESHDRHQGSHGVFGGMFHRGFFSKPVVRSEEENYRYLMALDR